MNNSHHEYDFYFSAYSLMNLHEKLVFKKTDFKNAKGFINKLNLFNEILKLKKEIKKEQKQRDKSFKKLN